MHEVSRSTREWADLMNVVSAQVVSCVTAGVKAGLTKEAAALAAVIGCLSVIRVDGLNEANILQMAKANVPTDGTFQQVRN